jgi:hypothetical protein
LRVVAVDWSGDARAAGQRARIWTAVAEEGELVSLTSGRTRQETVEHLCTLAAEDSRLVVGIDFAFSMPAWFLEWRALPDAPALWRTAAVEGERWLSEVRPPFWGRRGVARPPVPAHFRQTERTCVRVAGIGPKSVFQVGGAGSVGTGSIRGMPYLVALRQAGFHVWPFDAGGPPLVVEIYPRILTGPVVKRRGAARRQHLATLGVASEPCVLAEKSEDAFDAAVSALAMSRCAAELGDPPPSPCPLALLEGEIWAPRATLRSSA